MLVDAHDGIQDIHPVEDDHDRLEESAVADVLGLGGSTCA
jgi:hypothetical protein